VEQHRGTLPVNSGPPGTTPGQCRTTGCWKSSHTNGSESGPLQVGDADGDTSWERGVRRTNGAFSEAEYPLAATGVPISLDAHQNRILRDVFTHNSEGRFPYQTVIYSAPKKSGKTEIGGLVALWMAFTEGPYAEVYTPANDLEQSPSRVFRAAGRAIQANPRLSSVRVGKDVIRLPDWTEIKTVAGDYGRGSPGKYIGNSAREVVDI
jgi:hypothetical protein